MIWQQLSIGFARLEDMLDQVEWHNVVHVFSPCLVAALAANIVAVLLKILILTIKTRGVRGHEIGEVAKSGGMPSSHSATVCALAMAIGVSSGFGSPIFALAVIFAIVVMVDATQVRRAVGEQGQVLQALLLRENVTSEDPEDAPPEHGSAFPYHARGHKPSEVLVGALVGIVCGVLIAAFMVP